MEVHQEARQSPRAAGLGKPPWARATQAKEKVICENGIHLDKNEHVGEARLFVYIITLELLCSAAAIYFLGKILPFSRIPPGFVTVG